MRAIQLKNSNKELEQFAYVASHDLQEPLRKTQAFGERLESRYSGQLDAQGVDFINRMRSAASRMSVLINDLLSFSRVTTRPWRFATKYAAVIPHFHLPTTQGHI